MQRRALASCRSGDRPCRQAFAMAQPTRRAICRSTARPRRSAPCRQPETCPSKHRPQTPFESNRESNGPQTATDVRGSNFVSPQRMELSKHTSGRPWTNWRRWTGIEPAGRGSPVPTALKAAEPTRYPDISGADVSGQHPASGRRTAVMSNTPRDAGKLGASSGGFLGLARREPEFGAT